MGDIVEYKSKDGTDIQLSFDIVRNYLVQGKPNLVQDGEIVYFMGVCKARGLNPFKKDCYLIKYSDKTSAQIITSIDYFRSRARAQDDCTGWSVGLLVYDPETKIVSDTKGLVLPGSTVLGAWFEAKPEGWENVHRREVNLSGYLQYKSDGKLTKFWLPEKQPSQIMKVAESQGLRAIWPDQFQNLYTDGEADLGGMPNVTIGGASLPNPPDPQYSGVLPPLTKKRTYTEPKNKPKPDPSNDKKQADDSETFDLIVAKKADKEQMDKFLEVCSGKANMTVAQIKTQAIRNIGKFMGQYEKWAVDMDVQKRRENTEQLAPKDRARGRNVKKDEEEDPPLKMRPEEVLDSKKTDPKTDPEETNDTETEQGVPIDPGPTADVVKCNKNDGDMMLAEYCMNSCEGRFNCDSLQSYLAGQYS